MEKYSYDNNEVRMTANMYINKFNYSQTIIQKQMSQLYQQGQKIINLELEVNKMEIDYRVMQDASLFKDSYIQ